MTERTEHGTAEWTEEHIDYAMKELRYAMENLADLHRLNVSNEMMGTEPIHMQSQVIGYHIQGRKKTVEFETPDARVKIEIEKSDPSVETF